MLMLHKAKELGQAGEKVLFLIAAENHPCLPTLLTSSICAQLKDSGEHIEVRQVHPDKVLSLILAHREEGW